MGKQSKSKKIYEQVAEHIKQMIEQGVLLPGDKLPPMTELAAQFSVSRAAVREAFSSLVGMGLIDLRHGEGTFVQKIDVQTMVTEPMNAALLLGMGDLKQLLEVRRLLETGIVQHACERATEAELCGIEEALRALREARDCEAAVSADLQFHLAIAAAAHNEVLANLMNTLSETIRSVLRETWAQEQDESLERLQAQHLAIFEAVRARDKARAAEAMALHLRESEGAVVRLKGQAGAKR